MTLSLICHPDFLANGISAVDVEVTFNNDGFLTLAFCVSGKISELKLLEPCEPKRTDYLWQQTCFEAFVGAKGQGSYLEYNLSPSTEWAVYAFEDHRRGMRNPELITEPVIGQFLEQDMYFLTAELDLRKLPGMDAGQLELAATAVIEEKNGPKSLWALAHPSGNPDFHSRDCFVHQLEGVVSQ
ncbi:MAG: hypothetical protein Pars2KO_29750 [Parasphingorhabdus sp.]